MIDRRNPYRDEPASESDEAASDLEDPASDDGRDAYLTTTKPTRTRPNALDLERPHD